MAPRFGFFTPRSRSPTPRPTLTRMCAGASDTNGTIFQIRSGTASQLRARGTKWSDMNSYPTSVARHDTFMLQDPTRIGTICWLGGPNTIRHELKSIWCDTIRHGLPQIVHR